MPQSPSPGEHAAQRLAGQQHGAVASRQLHDLGVPRELVRQRMRAQRWQRAHPGVYVLHTGPLPPLTRVWAALLYAGEVAVASHETAAWLHGLLDTPPDRVHVLVPHGHRHRPSRDGVQVRQSRHLAARRQGMPEPPRTRVEDTVLDLADRTRDAHRVVGLVLTACQRRLTTPARLRRRLGMRPRARWRVLIQELLTDAADGVASPLERRYRDDVERPHGLPSGERNRPGQDSVGSRLYRDVRYPRWRTVVELDGRAAHPDEGRDGDQLRDGELLADEDARTVRLGWVAVTGQTCRSALVVAGLLRRGGWTGELTPCGPACRAASPRRIA
jgi:hypothetical protein